MGRSPKAFVMRYPEPTRQTGPQRQPPRDIIKASNSYYDFMVEETWLTMPRNRNNTAHVYDENAAKRLMTASIEH